MAERVSRSVRRLDDIQMRVQRALALVEDVINLRGCAEVTRLLTGGWGVGVGHWSQEKDGRVSHGPAIGQQRNYTGLILFHAGPPLETPLSCELLVPHPLAET